MIQPTSPNKTEALKNYFEQMDINAIEAFLPDDTTYQDYSKGEFINRLREIFNQFKEGGDTCLIAVSGKCSGGCYKNHKGFCLVGNQSANFIMLIICEQNGILKDVKECANFKQETVLCKLNEQLFIDDMTGWIIAGNSRD